MPSWRAMATAVSWWSPVIITGRMPAWRHWSMAAFTSGRTGSIMPARPMKHRACSRSRGLILRQAAGPGAAGGGQHPQGLGGHAVVVGQDGLAALLRHRQGLSALPIVGAAGQHLIRRALGILHHPVGGAVRRWTSSCGRSRRGPRQCGGCPAPGGALGRPHWAAKDTRAASVGSPRTVPSGFCTASLHRAMAAASCPASPVWSTTVILFWVRVPVLSEQITWVQPSVSTAVRRRITALRRLMRVTPMLSTTVTTVARPSGMAATARDTATMKVFRMPDRGEVPGHQQVKHENEHADAQHQPGQRLAQLGQLLCSGVSSCSVRARTPAILPISVSIPVAVTTMRPRP